MGRGGFGGMPLTPARQGRKMKVEGLVEDITDEMMSRYFERFGQVVDSSRDWQSYAGYIVFMDASMAQYCLRRRNHQIDGNEIKVTLADPFEEEEAEGEAGAAAKDATSDPATDQELPPGTG